MITAMMAVVITIAVVICDDDSIYLDAIRENLARVASASGASESPAPTLYVRDYAVTDVLCKQSLL